jgi:hypothetical protein
LSSENKTVLLNDHGQDLNDYGQDLSDCGQDLHDLCLGFESDCYENMFYFRIVTYNNSRIPARGHYTNNVFYINVHYENG